MLEPIFGNTTVEKVLLYLSPHGDGYARFISRVFGISVNGVSQQLKRLEEGEVAAAIPVGRVRLFRIHPRYPFRRELLELLREAMGFIPERTEERYFRNRTCPRRTGAPLCTARRRGKA